MTEIVKVCKHHGELTKENTTKNNGYNECKFCRKIARKKTYLKHREKRLIENKKYYNKNKETLALKYKIYKKLHPEIRKKITKTYYDKNKEKCYKRSQSKKLEYRKDIRKSYVTELLTSKILKAKDIPITLIEAKKAHLQLKRKLKDLKNVNK